MTDSTTMTLTMDQHIRNQMSLMAWIMAFLCGWVMFISARAIGADHATLQTDKTAVPVISTTAQP